MPNFYCVKNTRQNFREGLEQEIDLIISTTTTQFLGKLFFLFSSVFTLMPCVDDSQMLMI